MPEKNEKLDHIIQALFHVQKRPGMYFGVDTYYKALIHLLTGITLGAAPEVKLSNSGEDNHFEEVTEHFGFEWSPMIYWHQMAEAGKSDQAIFDMMIQFEIEVLRRRYNYSHEDIQRLQNEIEAQFEARKQKLNKHSKRNE